MTEEEAQRWLANYPVSRETMDALQHLVDYTLIENSNQNLIAPSTEASIWSRHIVDSAQLLALADDPSGAWVDLGSGAGFPGLVVAIMSERPVTLVEMRRRRADHLSSIVRTLHLESRVKVVCGKVDQLLPADYRAISARAFAPLEKLFATAIHLADPATQWLLPKGRSAHSELEAVRGTWQGDMRLVPSMTDPDAHIIVARDVHPRRQR